MSDIVESAKELFQKDHEYWNPIYEAARQDLYFLSDKSDAQWLSEDIRARKKTGRPVLTIDQLGQYVNQVVNDIRKNTPSIEVIPDVDGAQETADVQQDLIRDILYNSDADTCFDIAAAYAVKGSIGFFRVDSDYIRDDSFDQQLMVHAVHDPFSCYLDKDSRSITGEDATRCFILDVIDEDTFKKDYPKAKPVNFTDDSFIDGGKGDIIVAEYFKCEYKKKTIGLSVDGELEEVQDGVEYVQKRKIEEKKVKRYLLSGDDVLEESEFVCDFIPLIPVFGNQQWVNGEREIHSLIRKSKDAQRMFNYWKSLETELLQKQPRSNFLAAAGQVEDFREEWENPELSPVLRYKPTDIGGNPVPTPQRLEPPVIPTGVINASRSAVDDIKATIGMYAASLGQESNEVSGIAIQRRNEEGDTATYHFSDNLTKSINHLGRMLVNAIPKVYDMPRFVTVIDKEGVTKKLGINGAMAEDQDKPFYLTEGRYKTKVVTGASYTTQRQEAAAFFNNAVMKNPELMAVMGDLMFKNMDFAGADAMAERMKKYIDPKYLETEEEYDPEKQQMAEVIQEGEALITEYQGQIEVLMSRLESKERELSIKAQSEEYDKQRDDAKSNLELMKLESERIKSLRSFEIEKEKIEQEFRFKMEALQIKRDELNLKAAKELTTEEEGYNESPDFEQVNEQPESVEVEINS